MPIYYKTASNYFSIVQYYTYIHIQIILGIFLMKFNKILKT